MPHIVIEYSGNEIDDGRIEHLLDEVVALSERSSAIDARNLKLRARPVGHYRVAGRRGAFAHASVILMKGRERGVLDGLIADLHDVMAARLEDVPQVTVELREVDVQDYRKR